MGDSQYSFSLTTFRYGYSIFVDTTVCGMCAYLNLFCCTVHFNSPSGKLVQIEHALTAVGSGQTSLGIKGMDF